MEILSLQMLLILVCLISTFAFVYNHSSPHFTCEHKEFPNSIHNLYDTYNSHGNRILQTAEWESIRIYVDYSMVDSDPTLNSDWVTRFKQVIGNAVSVIQALYQVKRATVPLVVDNCDNLTIPSEISSSGVNADLIILAGYYNGTGTEGLAAFAASCAYDQTTKRPIMGVLAFTGDADFGTEDWLKWYTMIALHEMHHVLAFSTLNYANFIDANGNPLGIKNVVKNVTVEGDLRQAIVTERAVAAAKQHYNCDSMEFILLEQWGTNKTAGNHWESRIMLGDFMVGQVYYEMFISEITLAFMEDSGWYMTKPYTGGLFKFGKNAGCNFLDTKCIVNDQTSWGNEFCKETLSSICLANRKVKGFCYLEPDSKLNGTEVAPAEFTYISGESGDPIVDYCPVATCHYTAQNMHSQSCVNGLSYYPSSLGEEICPDCNCFQSSLTPVGDSASTAFKGNYFPICYKITCNYTESYYIVSIGNSAVVCPKEGGSITVNGYDGQLECTDFNLMCTQENGSCSDAIECALNNVTFREPVYGYTYDNGQNKYSPKLSYDAIIPMIDNLKFNYTAILAQDASRIRTSIINYIFILFIFIFI